jgi:hypothetical protein
VEPGPNLAVRIHAQLIRGHVVETARVAEELIDDMGTEIVIRTKFSCKSS